MGLVFFFFVCAFNLMLSHCLHSVSIWRVISKNCAGYLVWWRIEQSKVPGFSVIYHFRCANGSSMYLQTIHVAHFRNNEIIHVEHWIWRCQNQWDSEFWYRYLLKNAGTFRINLKLLNSQRQSNINFCDVPSHLGFFMLLYAYCTSSCKMKSDIRESGFNASNMFGKTK